jgi:hypothetical protein
VKPFAQIFNRSDGAGVEMWNTQVAEILSRSRKVRSQIPNKTDLFLKIY